MAYTIKPKVHVSLHFLGFVRLINGLCIVLYVCGIETNRLLDYRPRFGSCKNA
jgi:hypothetical protein